LLNSSWKINKSGSETANAEFVSATRSTWGIMVHGSVMNVLITEKYKVLW
jgi:phosphoglucomutase